MARRRTIAGAALLSVILSLAPSFNEVSAMTQAPEAAVRLLRLPDEAYFDFNPARQTQLQQTFDAAAHGDETADMQGDAGPAPAVLAVGAPQQIDLSKQSATPVLVGSVRSKLRDWQVNFKTNLHLLVRDLDTGRLIAIDPLLNMRRGQLQLPSAAGERPRQSGSTTAVTLVDLGERLSAPLPPGRYAVTALAVDWVSNTVAVAVQGREGAAPDTSPTPLPVKVVPDAGEHLATQVMVPASAHPGGPIQVEVALQLGRGQGVHGADTSEPFWPANLIVVKLDQRAHVAPVRVPLQRIHTAAGVERFNARFQVDLAPALHEPPGGRYLIYLDVGAGLLGPYAMTVGD